MVNTILAKRINHIVAKGDNPVWPKGSKSRGFSTNVTLTIKSTDLKEFAEHLVKKTVRGIRDSFIRPEEDYLTIKEASQILHTDKSTLWRWHKIGYLCRLEIGGKRLYRKSDVDAILQKENN